MPSFDLFVLLVAGLANVLVGLFILLKNYTNRTNQLFAAISVVLVAWMVSNYFSLILANPGHIFISVKTILSIIVLQNAIFLFFVFTFPAGALRLKRGALYAYLGFTALTFFISIYPGFFRTYRPDSGFIVLIASPLILLFILHTVFSIAVSVRSLIGRFRYTHGLLHNQYAYLLVATSVLYILTPVTNFVLPNVFQIVALQQLSPVYNFLFAAIIAYAIVAQRLFDIRAAVARSVAYVLLLGFMASIYAVTLFGGINVLFAGPKNETLRQVLSVVIAILLALGFHGTKRFFDRLTNRIFYRDNYDSQAVLDEFSSLLVAEINLDKIIRSTRSIMLDSVKSSNLDFILIEKNQPRLESANGQPINSELHQLVTRLKGQRKDILVLEELSIHNPLRELYTKNNVAVILRLKTQHQIVGYLLFGTKRSGDVYSSQDIKLLAIVANELAIGIQNALRFEEIQRFNITLQEKIKEATAELRKVNARLRQLDKSKDEFISMASHQLRTPLTTIKGYLSMVIEGDVGPVTKTEKEYIKKAFDGAQKMVYLIADLLNVSRLQTGKFVIENHPTNLAEVVESEIAQMQETAELHKLKLVYHKPDNFPMLNLDETKIRQVVMNFIDNALYYTPAGGTVTVELTANDSQVIFTVTDTGMGVPAAVQPHLFSKFYRADNAKKVRPDGTGLGLFMVKKVISAQGGAIIFKSTEGKGSTFGFSFPRASLIPS